MDEARHLDVFRKRALANGVGLLQAGTGAVGLLTAQSFIEMTTMLHLVGEGFVQSVFRMGELIAHSEVDKKIYEQLARRAEVDSLKSLCDGLGLQLSDTQQKLDAVSGLQQKLLPLTAQIATLKMELEQTEAGYRALQQEEEQVEEQQKRLAELMARLDTAAPHLAPWERARDRVLDFLYFNDFYLVSAGLCLALLYLFVRQQ
jgi:DNA repair ATPase RecN